MAGSRKPQVGEVWRRRRDGETATVTAVGENQLLYKTSGDPQEWSGRIEWFTSVHRPPKPPLPPVPETIYLPVTAEYTGAYSYRSRDGATKEIEGCEPTIAVAEYRLVEVRER